MNPAAGHDALPEIVEQHATEAAFCWRFRDAAARSPAYDLLELCELDHRLECHLDGLRAAGDLGWELCLAALEDDDPAVLFPAALLAVEREDWAGFAHVLDAGAEEPARARAFASALGFLPFDRLRLVWAGMLAADSPAPLLLLGVAGHAIHRRDLGRTLAHAAASRDVRLRVRAYRAIGELHREDLRRELRAGLSDADEACRFWAAWSAALLRDGHAPGALAELAAASPRYGERASDMAARAMAPADARRFVESLAARGGAERAAIVGAGALGDPALAPWLLTQAAKAETARLAAWSLTLITNADVAGELPGKPPQGFASGPSDDPDDEDVAMDPDEDLPWPDAGRLGAWVRARSLAGGSRHLLGKPMDPGWLRHVLRAGNQAARAAAAIELCLRGRGEPLFEVRAPGYVQLGALPPPER
ncbi:TIGR02270 family protein [Sorangium sp. So ce131]|uniref:TIGR02270 family protein n=1 Tax=Sorangium sp. So ce131 TaxID=3133282 RepID=UPI003F62FF32